MTQELGLPRFDRDLSHPSLAADAAHDYHLAVCKALDELRLHDKGNLDERNQAWRTYNQTMSKLHDAYLFRVGGVDAVVDYHEHNDRLTLIRASKAIGLALKAVGSTL